MYENDVKFGLSNESKASKHIEKFLKEYVKKFENKYSIFDYYIEDINSNTKINNKRVSVLFELKSRRNTIDKFNTQLIGQNKIRYGRTIMNKKKDYEVFYFYLLEGLKEGTHELYLYIDEVNKDLEVRRLGNYARGDKSSNLCIVDNQDLIYCSTF